MAALVCDDHPLMRSALEFTLRGFELGDVVAVSDFALAWEAVARRDDWSLCVADLHMPGIGPIEGLRGLRERAPGMKIVVLTGSDDDCELADCIELGVDGFVPKTLEPGIVESALRLVLAGGRYFPERVAELAFRGGVRSGSTLVDRSSEGEAQPYGRLSARHIEVLDQLARGRSNKEIARLLSLSPATVKAHVAHILAVMGVTNRTEAAARARTDGLV